MPIRVHVFKNESSGEVYDITQTDSGIRSGDVLIVPKEGIAGIMDKAWPVAFTVNHGEFHTPTDISGNTHRNTYPDAVDMAVFMAYAYDWEVAIALPFRKDSQ